MNATAAEPRMTRGEISAALAIPVSTVVRLFDDGALRPIRERGWRKAYADQVSYIADQMNARRPGSIEEFAREWLAANPVPVPVPATAVA